MDFIYRDDTLPRVKRRMIFRGLVHLLVSIGFGLTYVFGFDWYVSLLPAFIFLLISIADFIGIKTMEKHRRAIKISLSDIGITVYALGVSHPITWKWNQIKLVRKTHKKREMTSFTINTGDRYNKQFTFTDELTSFNTLYEMVSEQTNV